MDDVRKRVEQTAEEREEYEAKQQTKEEKAVGATEDGEDSPERESVSASMCSNKV